MTGLRLNVAVVALAAALSAAIVAVVALPTLAEPTEFDARLAAAEANADQAAKLLRQKDLAPAFPSGAVCTDAAAGAQALRRQAEAMAQAAGLQAVSVETAPAGSAQTLEAVTLRLDATGSYAAAMSAVAQVSELRPLVFVDRVDLASKTSFVTLSLSGRAYCSGRP